MNTPPTAELRALMDRLLDQGGLNHDESDRLVVFLRDPMDLRYHAEIMLQESMMADALNRIAKETEIPRFPAKKLVLGCLAVAACLVISLWIFTSFEMRDDPSKVVFAPSDVRVTGLQGVEWAKAGSPVRPNGRLVEARVATRSGLIELTYPGGVRVTLQGATDFRVRDRNSGVLTRGRLVAHVPPGAEGFTIDYGTGRVVDLGTEFGLGVHDGKIELSVFDGMVEITLPDGSSHRIRQGKSLAYDESDEVPFREVALEGNPFVRTLPENDFPWEMDLANPESLVFDVTSLISKPGKYLAVFKWTGGAKGMYFSDVELRLDGKTMAMTPRQSISGASDGRHDTLNVMDLNQESFPLGRWTLHARGTPLPPLDTASSMIRGVLMFENEFAVNATPADFIGRWNYKYGNASYIREFHEDGHVSLYESGRESNHEYFANSRWTLENGLMKVHLPSVRVNEYHILRDAKTMLFMNQPYENAVKIEDE